MKMQIKDFAALTGVSIRTLRYYDQIGLLKPGFVDEGNGYRYYDDASLERMREILFLRELDFSLRSIKEILSSENYDKKGRSGRTAPSAGSEKGTARAADQRH